MTTTTGFGQAFENNILGWIRGTAFPAVPADLFVALFTTAPVDGSDASAVEVAGNNYARCPFVPNGSNFGAPSGAAPASIVSGADFNFNTPSGAWGTVVGWAIYTLVSGGTLVYYGAFSGVAIGINDTVKFSSGNFTLRVN